LMEEPPTSTPIARREDFNLRYTCEFRPLPTDTTL
jgi:hypothetical protein